MSSCIICNALFEKYADNAYNKCASCGSYIFVSESSAADLNKKFYNNQIISKYHVDILKKNIFYFFKSLDKLKRVASYKDFDARHAVVLDTLQNVQKKVLEVGFGSGENLVRLLDSGIDAYGIDISEANVASFASEYPRYAGKVSCATKMDSPVDVVYTSALFEHLDDPHGFLAGITSSLSSGGVIVLDNIPVASELEATIPPSSDICFWDGIHKAVYTRQAIADFAVRNGYELSSYGHFDYFTYRILSAHKFYGYSIIEHIRHPFMSGDQLPGMWDYVRLCSLAISMNSPALLGFAVLKKLA